MLILSFSIGAAILFLEAILAELTFGEDQISEMYTDNFLDYPVIA